MWPGGLSSLTRDGTWAQAVSVPRPKHWTAREFLYSNFYNHKRQEVLVACETSERGRTLCRLVMPSASTSLGLEPCESRSRAMSVCPQ